MRPVNAEFNWWLLIVGLVVGAALVWLVLADSSRRESEISAEELPKEAAWIASTVSESGRPLEPDLAEEVLRLHRVYLRSLPPDEDDGWSDEAWVAEVDAGACADQGVNEPASAAAEASPPGYDGSAPGHHPAVEGNRTEPQASD